MQVKITTSQGQTGAFFQATSELNQFVKRYSDPAGDRTCRVETYYGSPLVSFPTTAELEEEIMA